NEADVREAGIRGADFPSTVCGRIENPPHEDRRSDPLNAACDAYRFLWSWVVVYFAFYSLSATKLPNYILPAIMPLGILLARFAQRWRDGTIQPPAVTLHLSLGSLVFIGLVLAAGLGILAGIVALPALRGQHLPVLSLWLPLSLLSIGAAALGWTCWRRGRPANVFPILAVLTVIQYGLMAGWVLHLVNPLKAPQPLVELADAECPEVDLRLACYRLEYLPSLNFYSKREVTLYKGEQDAVDFLCAPQPRYLFVPAHQWQELAEKVVSPHRVVGLHFDIYRGRAVVVVSNRP